MAVAMEVAWRAPELAGSSGSKRAWGADTKKLMQLMMGQFGGAVTSSATTTKPTLDLLGSSREFDSQPEFLELDPDQPLPPNWEKCLDLKTGEIYFVNKSTEVRTSQDPRKGEDARKNTEDARKVAAPHEFLASKRSETLREESLRASTSSASATSAGESPPQQRQSLSFSTGKQLWSLQLDEPRSSVSLLNKSTTAGAGAGAPLSTNSQEEDLELDLNLSAGGGGGPSPRHQGSQSVCTMEMVEQALKRMEKAMGKRPKLVSVSSSFSSLTSARSGEPGSHSSTPSTSSTSSSSVDISRVSEAESQKEEDALVMGACTRCSTYVMLHKSDPKCPRCESEAPLDSFIAPPLPASKRQKLQET